MDDGRHILIVRTNVDPLWDGRKATAPNFAGRIAFNVSGAPKNVSKAFRRIFLSHAQYPWGGIDAGATGLIAARQAVVHQLGVGTIGMNQNKGEYNESDGDGNNRGPQ